MQFTEVMVPRPIPGPALPATPIATAALAPTSRKYSELAILALGIALGIAISAVLVILHR